jgi:hypothetical protein
VDEILGGGGGDTETGRRIADVTSSMDGSRTDSTPGAITVCKLGSGSSEDDVQEDDVGNQCDVGWATINDDDASSGTKL